MENSPFSKAGTEAKQTGKPYTQHVNQPKQVVKLLLILHTTTTTQINKNWLNFPKIETFLK